MIGKSFSKEDAREILPKRKEDANKGDAGKVLIVAGSSGMAGAAILAAKGAYRAGAGLVKVAAPSEVISALQVAVPEATTLVLSKIENNGNGAGKVKNQNECLKEALLGKKYAARVLAESKNFDAIVVGPGLGKTAEAKALVEELIKTAEIPMVLDADALNIIANNTDILLKTKTSIIMTPHPAEMGRLIKKSAADVNSSREEAAASFSKKYSVTLVLKGAGTVVASPEGDISINTTGNSGMATAGSGDVLSGIAGAFSAVMPSEKAARLAVYVHGLAGDIGTEEEGIFGLMASDIANNTGKALRLITD